MPRTQRCWYSIKPFLPDISDLHPLYPLIGWTFAYIGVFLFSMYYYIDVLPETVFGLKEWRIGA